VTDPTTPLRRDAERNRQLLLRTAHDLMARHGLDVPYEEIARAAGTGTGTMYRRFPQRQDLVDALFGSHIDAVTELAVEASRHTDALAGLTWFLSRQLELEAANRGLGDLLRGAHRDAGIVQLARARMTPLVADLIARAVQAGQLSPGVTPADLVAVHLMVGSVLDASREFAPDLWRRALAIALAGLSHAELPGGPPDDAVIESLYNAR
jgi:AcrR family transcriptional regulator